MLNTEMEFSRKKLKTETENRRVSRRLPWVRVSVDGHGDRSSFPIEVSAALIGRSTTNEGDEFNRAG